MSASKLYTVYIKITKSAVAFLVVLFMFQLPAVNAVADNGETVVYITKTGEKYHREGCSYLKSCIPITLADAVAAGYDGCSRCKPPVLSSSESEDNAPYIARGASEPTARSMAPQPTARPSPRPTPSPRPSAQEPIEDKSPLGNMALGGGIAIAAGKCIASIQNSKKRKEEAEKKYQEEKEKYSLLYGGKALEDCCNAPPGHSVGLDGLPKSKGNGKWGSVYTFYVTPSGTAFHKEFRCYGAHIPINASNIKGRTKCSRCNPSLPDLNWYIKYREIKQIKEKYGIE